MKVLHLILWVNHQRPAPALRDQDPVLCGDSVTRQTFCVPLTDDKWVAQNVDQTKAGADGNT